MTTEIRGHVAPGFEAVRECFAANFERDDAYREVGASFAVYRGEELVVDLAAGWRDAAGEIAWTSDTLANVWSTTKGVTAIALAVLVDRGLIDYAAPAADYWPQFAQNGKARITVSQLLSHQAGLPGFVEPTSLEDFYDWDTVVGRLARPAPMWTPGTRNSYHAMTFGFLAGELIRRTSGMSVGRFLATELAGPLDADVFIGLPPAQEHRVAPLIAPRAQTAFDVAAMAPEAIAAITNPLMAPTLCNDRAWRAAEIPAGNGHATALGLARLYGAVAGGGALGGVRIMGPQTIAALETVQTKRVDVMLGLAPFWRNGVHGNETGLYGPEKHVFGHNGWGGSFGCADTRGAIAIGYVMNQMGEGILGDVRGAALCDAVYACL
jgi:CubicO group peptidase (beta-lactamase class C family)